MIQKLKNLYNKYARPTIAHRVLARIFDYVVDIYAAMKHFSFPKQYIRRWKLDMLEELYEKETTALFKKIIKPGMVIVDIGAHIGYFTRIFSRLTESTGKVYAFEADPENFALLKNNTKQPKNIAIFQLAISNRAGLIDFFHSELKTGCHSTIPSPLRQTKITVTASTLDELAQKENINRVDVIKMDIEGGEVAALSGMTNILSVNPNLQLVTEFNPECFLEANIDPLFFMRRLEESGFRIFAIGPKGELEAVRSNMTLGEIMKGQKFVNVYCTRQPPTLI